MVKIRFVSADDWQGIYVHNDLVIKQHSIDALTGIKAISDHITIYLGFNFNHFIVEEYKVDSEWLEIYGELPIKFDQILNRVLTQYL